MPTAYNVSAAAAVVGVSPSTLRNWLRQYAKHLSDGATPPPGQDRILTDADVAKLQFVKAQRDALKDYPDIAAELAAMPADTALQPYIDVTPSTPVATPTPALQQPAISADLVQALQMIVARQDSDLQRQIDEIRETSIQRYQGFVLGILVGVIITAIVLALVWAGMSLR